MPITLHAICRPIALAIASPLLTLLLAACSGGSSSGGSGPGPGPGAGPISTNQPPVASFTATTLAGVEPLSVTFDASASRDPDGTIRSYTWYPYGSSGYGVESPTSTYGPVLYEAGEYTVVLQVVDQAGGTARTTLRIVVTPGPRGDVEIRYRDRYGLPIPGLVVGVASDIGGSRYAATGADGTALISNVLAGPACAGRDDDWGGVYPCNAVTVVANQRTVVDLQFEYPTGPAGLVQSTRTRIVDADTIDLESDIYVFSPDGEVARDAPSGAAASLLGQGRQVQTAPSEPPAVFAYSIDSNTQPLIEGVAGAAAPTAYHAGVLVDVSYSNPPPASLLYATKELLRTAAAADGFVLAAFARSEKGAPALLPVQPVTRFPRANPGFVADGTALFAEVDSLRTLGGGARPLYDAVDAMVDFMATHTPDGTRRALVVMTNDEDTTCGNASACRSRLQAATAHAVAAGVDLVYASRRCCDLPNSATLGQAGRGGMTQLSHEATVMRNLGAVLDGTAPRYRVRFRLKAATPGAFQAGRTLHGTYAVTTPVATGKSQTVWLPFIAVL